MRLQDLRDDLAEAFPATIRDGNPPSLWRIVELARRVCALFDDCPCDRCKGAAPSGKGFEVLDPVGLTYDQEVRVLLALARCLFADGSPTGERRVWAA